MKKKYVAPLQDKRDWVEFTKQLKNISPKEADSSQKNIETNKIRKLDLHGHSLIESNKIVKEFIIQSYEDGYKKLLIVTGKGLRSKSHNNPYVSEELSVLKYSVPEFIKNEVSLNSKVNRISKVEAKNGGEGAIYIFLKKNKKL